MILSFVILLGSLIINVAFLTLAERHLLAACQRRIGPNQVGIIGILQPIFDGLKLILKEILIPLESNQFLFLLTPYFTFGLALLNWVFLPLNYPSGYLIENSTGILILLAISELGIYGIIFSGWSANSKYPFIGAIRSAAQMISYSIS
jgi:NADH:ubiquinone oxidoreductase subunit H